MVVLEWLIWAVALLFLLSLVWGVRSTARRGRSVHVVLLLSIVLVLCSVIVFAFLRWNKLHLLWAVPAALICAFVVGFIILPIPVIGHALRAVSLACAHVSLVGTNWRIGGLPWELSTFRILRRRARLQERNEQCATVEDLEAAIKRHEEQLFGITLYCAQVNLLYGDDQEVVMRTEQAYAEILERAESAISNAKAVLERVRNGAGTVAAIRKLTFPPIRGTTGLDEMTKRATLLVMAYEKLFPGRPRSAPLTEEEHWQLVDEAMKDFSP